MQNLVDYSFLKTKGNKRKGKKKKGLKKLMRKSSCGKGKPKRKAQFSFYFCLICFYFDYSHPSMHFPTKNASQNMGVVRNGIQF
jgi:hypothetical protein